MTETITRRFMEAGFTNDLVFMEVLRRNPDILQEILQLCIPGIDAASFTLTESEHEIVASLKNKRVRLDLVSRSEASDIIAGLEMFTYDPNLPMYARYVRGMLDSELPVGSRAKDLPEQILLIFCTFDPMKGGDPVYRTKLSLDGREDLCYTENWLTIYFSPASIEKAPEQLRPFLKLLKGIQDTSDPLVQKIDEAVRKVKSDGDFRRMAMDQFEKEECIRELTEEKTRKIVEAEMRELVEEEKQKRIKMEEDAVLNCIRLHLLLGHSEDCIQDLISKKYDISKEETKKLLYSVNLPA